MTSGILTRDRSVLSDTIVTDSSVSRLYFEENIVDIAAVGAEAEIVIDKRSVPRIPQKYIVNIIINGNTNSFRNIAKRQFKSLRPFKRLLCAKW